MIKLTRLNGDQIMVNPDQILWVESTPDTVITLHNGSKVTVKETSDQVASLILKHKQEIQAERGL